MDEPNKYVFLLFQMKVLRFFGILPSDGESEKQNWKKLSSYKFVIVMLPNTIPLIIDMVLISIEDFDLVIFIEPLLALVCIFGEHYMIFCFMRNRPEIIKLVNRVGDFQKFSSLEDMIETDKRAIFYTKILLMYSAIGSLTYVSMPLLMIDRCLRDKPTNKYMVGMPCGLVARVRWGFDFDFSPLREMQYLNQVWLVFTISWIMISLTMFLCSFLVHATHHLKKLRELILQLSGVGDEEIGSKLIEHVVYHIYIIQYCDDLNEAFGSQVFMHITLTSFIFSILGFKIIMVRNIDAVRFALHLMGWLFLLLVVCYYGQTLIDESTGLGNDAYSIKWYNAPVSVQKDLRFIIMRCQKPITLKALNVGYTSLETFLKVMSSAYSYLTLLINIK